MTLEVQNWDTIADNNTTVAGTNISEGCLAANVNNALRAIMAAVKEFMGGIGTVTEVVTSLATVFAKNGVNVDITSLRSSTAISETGTVTATTLGFRGLPANTATGAHTFALTDQGECRSNTTGGWVIPANGSVAFPVGSFLAGFNDSGSNQTLSITTDTLRLAASTSTGSRTIAPYGLFSAWKKSATVWVVAGSGVT